ncbi:MAG: protein kinase, partial [Myxococcota bacterium]
MASAAAPRVTPFGNYLLDELLAEGGMARVYKARLRGVGGFEKPLVVKQILPELAQDPRFVALFVQEAKTLVRLGHPHIVPVYELGVVDGTYLLAMEYVEGATLRDVLRDGPLSPAAAAQLLAQVAEALDHAHDRFALVHRDVTPRNVLVDRSGQARLVDFGIAAPAEGEAPRFGSPGYMAPEQLMGGAIDGRADLFALGALLFESLTGAPAFAGEGQDEARRRILGGEGPALPATVPSALRELGAALLERLPADRPPDAATVARAFRAFLARERPEGAHREMARRVDDTRKRAAPVVQPAPAPEREPTGATRSLATAEMLTRALAASEAPPRAGSEPPGPTAPLDAPSAPPSPPRRRAGPLLLAGAL